MYRSEQKFVVDENTLQVMHHKLSGMLDYDENQKGDSYRIRSMYFDTYSRKSYRRMMRGLKNEKNIE